jgi:7,8-didemethyl-8-hydroxy-5-deazariboflavin synthase CofG subunit
MVVGYSLGNRNDKEDDIKVLGEDDPNVITYSVALPMILSRMCRNSCPYCSFRQKDNLAVPYSTIRHAKSARVQGAREALIEAGERVDKFPQLRSILDLWGFSSYLDYIYTVCELAFLEGLIPTIDVGFLSPAEMKRLSEICALIKIVLDSVDKDLYSTVYKNAPGKKLELMVKSLHWAGKLGFPTVTGIIVGIGESQSHRVELLKTIADVQKKYGSIHEVVIQNFVPEPGTAFSDKAPPTKEVMLKVVEKALEILPPEVPVIVPVELNPDIEDFIRAGVRNIGRIMLDKTLYSSVPTISIDSLNDKIENMGFKLQKRFPLTKEFIKAERYSKKLGQVFDAYKYRIKKDEQEKLKEQKMATNES